MTLFPKTLLIGAGLLAASLAHAGTTIDSRGFSLAYLYGGTGFDMSVLSDNGSTVQIAIRGMHPVMNDLSMTESEGRLGGEWDLDITDLAGSVRKGYRITSLTLGGTVTGAVDVAPLDPACGTPALACALGYAANTSSIAWSVAQGGQYTVLPFMRQDNVDGIHAFSQTGAVALTDDFTFEVNTMHSIGAEAGMEVYGPAPEDFRYVAAHAASSFGDMVLTVQVSAVPEPGSYAMMLGGLGLLGLVARRRRTALPGK